MGAGGNLSRGNLSNMVVNKQSMWRFLRHFSDGPCLQTIAVLTVVDSVPADNGATLFRPPYVGADKPAFSISTLRTDLLPALAPVGSPPALAAVQSALSHVQFDHVGGATGRR